MTNAAEVVLSSSLLYWNLDYRNFIATCERYISFCSISIHSFPQKLGRSVDIPSKLPFKQAVPRLGYKLNLENSMKFNYPLIKMHW